MAWIDFLENGVYGAAGIFAEVQEACPKLVAKGRSSLEPKLGVARIIGKFAVQGAEKEIRKRTDLVVEELSDIIALLLGDGSSSPIPDSDVPLIHQAGNRSDDLMVSNLSVANISADDLPIAGYETLSAQQVIKRISSLGLEELDLLEQFERSHRNRLSILKSVSAKKSKF